MAGQVENILTACGREAGQAELEHAREVIEMCRGLSRRELAFTLCEHWGWVSPTGSLQPRACEKLLEKWETAGLVRLPNKDVKQQRQSQARKPINATARTAEQGPISCKLAQLQPVWLEVVSDRQTTALWSEYVNRYHPLGCKRTIGCTLRYFVNSELGRLGCLLMGNAAVALAARDTWIGWSRQERLAHLPWVINNQRLLLFPWVRVPHLVSYVLGQLARRVQGDWEAKWNYRPVLMETFVDPAYYRGVGYRAAGWLLLGHSSGRGIRRGRHTYQTTPKMIFVRPLMPDFRVQLGSTEAMATRCVQVEQETGLAKAKAKARRKPNASKVAVGDQAARRSANGGLSTARAAKR